MMKLIYALSTMLLLAGCGRDQPKNAEDEQRRAPQAAAQPAPTRAEADHRPVIVHSATVSRRDWSGSRLQLSGLLADGN